MSASRVKGNVTQMTVARAVGVSPMTVSNAYNRPDKLSPALRQRILETARDLGYPGPNPVARSLRKGRAGSIGLLFGEALAYAFHDPGAVEFLRGLAEGTARHNTVLQLIAAKDADEHEGVSLLANAIVDGLVVWTLPDRHPLVRLARERHIPLVTHGSPRLDGVPFVGIDDRAAARAAAEHVLRLGHRSLAVISQPFGATRRARHRDPATLGRPGYRVTRERLAGYQAAASAAAPQPAALDIYEVAVNRRDEGHRAALALLQATPRPTAVLAMSDELAVGALTAARELNLCVPRDVSVLGWDDSPSARASDPALTTVGQSLHDQGRTCARLLIDATRGDLAAGDLVHLAPWQLITRDSTGPPPNRLPRLGAGRRARERASAQLPEPGEDLAERVRIRLRPADGRVFGVREGAHAVLDQPSRPVHHLEQGQAVTPGQLADGGAAVHLAEHRGGLGAERHPGSRLAGQPQPGVRPDVVAGQPFGFPGGVRPGPAEVHAQHRAVAVRLARDEGDTRPWAGQLDGQREQRVQGRRPEQRLPLGHVDQPAAQQHVARAAVGPAVALRPAPLVNPETARVDQARAQIGGGG